MRVMKPWALSILCPIVMLLGCRSERKTTESQDQPEVSVFNAQQVPSSPRSREVAKRVEPVLVRDLLSKGMTYGAPIFIRIFKDERELELWVEKDGKFECFCTYRIAAMSGVLGPKVKEGDGQAPEGFYFVRPSQMNPTSNYHLSFNLGYPNAYDRARGRDGSALMVHGNQVSIGCYAMTDPKIEEIYTIADAALRKGQSFFRVHCFPFRMTDENMMKNADSEWIDFWKNLKQGYDAFEKTRQVPNVVVRGKVYQVEVTQ
jgi:murein L,D-transpeptidase YafK